MYLLTYFYILNFKPLLYRAQTQCKSVDCNNWRIETIGNNSVKSSMSTFSMLPSSCPLATTGADNTFCNFCLNVEPTVAKHWKATVRELKNIAYRESQSNNLETKNQGIQVLSALNSLHSGLEEKMKHPGLPHGAVLNECNSDIIFEASKRLDKMKIENQDVSIQIASQPQHLYYLAHSSYVEAHPWSQWSCTLCTNSQSSLVRDQTGLINMGASKLWVASVYKVNPKIAMEEYQKARYYKLDDRNKPLIYKHQQCRSVVTFEFSWFTNWAAENKALSFKNRRMKELGYREIRFYHVETIGHICEVGGEKKMVEDMRKIGQEWEDMLMGMGYEVEKLRSGK